MMSPPVSVLAIGLISAVMATITESTGDHVGRHYQQCAQQPCYRLQDGTSNCTTPCNCALKTDTGRYPQVGTCEDPKPRTEPPYFFTY
uniref:8 kDa Amblyomma family member n=1 Tax=Rhipicephalus zambeziensis TaxID=60191 RepID=A0A224YEU8_9ACAR